MRDGKGKKKVKTRRVGQVFVLCGVVTEVHQPRPVFFLTFLLLLVVAPNQARETRRRRKRGRRRRLSRHSSRITRCLTHSLRLPTHKELISPPHPLTHTTPPFFSPSSSSHSSPSPRSAHYSRRKSGGNGLRARQTTPAVLK